MSRLFDLPLRDRARATLEIDRIAALLPPAAQNRVDMLAAASPNPEGVIGSLATLAEREPGAFHLLSRSPAGLQYLIAIFGHSRFLTAEVLDHPEWVEALLESGDMHRVLTPDEFRARLEADIEDGVPNPLALAEFRRRQILRILVRDVLGFGGLPEITAELSALADAIVETALVRIERDLAARFGMPSDPGFAVISLGKLGGMELNYSSDIDLMFLYRANGETDGSSRITNKEFYKLAANRLTDLLSTYTAEGLCYRVDLRLRPDGRLGEVAPSLDGMRSYYAGRARDWELQMMLKARISAGDRALGRELLEFVEPRTYSTTLDFSAIETMSATRARINEKLASRRQPEGDVKLARGGIRDIEFLVQCLQRLHGGREPWVRHGGTLLALSRLHDKNLISGAEYGRLAGAYQFLRHLEHRLQFDEDRQTHTLPNRGEELDQIARKMPGALDGGPALLAVMRRHFDNVVEIYERVVHSRTAPEPAAATVPFSRPEQPRRPRRASRNLDHLRERLAADPQKTAHLDSRVIDLVEHSPYFAEELIRTPEMMDEVGREPGAFDPPADPVELRRYYRRRMLRIQSQSLGGTPIFETLSRTSELTDAVIARAYRIAIAQTSSAWPPENRFYAPLHQMIVVALGRLGMREFDLASDADLVFVLPDSETPEIVFWRRAAERLIDILTAYTGEGVLFAVDTRLRPNGRAGDLVQTWSGFKEYFARAAEAWEGITYMKSRTVAGNPEMGEKFLAELQDVDWRRYGQSGRSRTDLRQMRMRLEKEQGTANPLKAGRGGYYDIDFVLMYLRLKSAGIFFKVLNTPERIDVIEKMGHLGREDAGFLREAATFYRALDHGQRLLTGHAEGKLPGSEAQLTLLQDMVSRWTPVPLERLPEIQNRTREVFDRLFG